MKKWITLSLLVLLSVSLVGCAKESTSSEEIEVMLFSVVPQQEAVLDEIIAGFEQANPGLTVNVQLVGYNDYFTKLQSDIAAGIGADVFELNYENAVTFYEKGIAAPLNDLIESHGTDMSSYSKSASDSFSTSSEQFALVSSFSTVVTYVNKDMFQDAGLELPADNWTWNDEISYAKKMQVSGGYGMVSPFQYHEFYKTVAQNGGALFDNMGNPTINRSENIEALQYMLDLVHTYGVSPQYLNPDQDVEMFSQQKTPMITSGIWLFDRFNDVSFDWDIVVEAGNTTGASHFFANGLALNRKSKNTDNAYKFMEYYTSNKDAVMKKIENSWELPATADPELIELYTQKGKGESRDVVFRAIKYVALPPVPQGVSFSEIQDIISISLTKAMNLELSAEEALATAQSQVEKLFQ